MCQTNWSAGQPRAICRAANSAEFTCSQKELPFLILFGGEPTSESEKREVRQAQLDIRFCLTQNAHCHLAKANRKHLSHVLAHTEKAFRISKGGDYLNKCLVCLFGKQAVGVSRRQFVPQIQLSWVPIR